VLSSQMRALCTDWVTTYHFSGVRANLLRPFEADLQGALTLEIGAGCGAITRYLAEAGAEVLALEGSPRRARIAKSRTEGLSNVTLLTDNFDHFETELRFDVITLIGVLEYAGRFVQGANPTVAMLEKVSRLLKPNGRLIIAIENQYGLKYFAGALEDHVGQAMFGIEDRYETQGVNTFGRAHLQRLLQEAGFAQNDFYAPFPDYKLPVSVVSQAGFDHPEFRSGELASQSTRRDIQLPHTLNFAIDQVWPGLARNQLGMELSNSFLVVSQKNGCHSKANNPVLAWHFSSERLELFSKATRFECQSYESESRIKVFHQRLYANGQDSAEFNDLQNHIRQSGSDDYTIGTTLATQYSRILLTPGWQQKDLARAVQTYLDIVYQVTGLGPKTYFDPEQRIDGKWLDLLPQNIILKANGDAQVIDDEWVYKQPISIGFLLYRAITALALSVHRVAPCKDATVRTPLQLIHAVFATLGYKISDTEVHTYTQFECHLQGEISGISQDPGARFDFLKTYEFSQTDLRTLYQQTLHQTAAQQHQLDMLSQSTWWKLGKPIRWAMRQLRRFLAV